jgi:hypothetical protein
MRTYEKSRFRGGASKSSQSIREWGNPRRTSESLVLTHYTIPDGSFLLYGTLCILSSGFLSFLPATFFYCTRYGGYSAPFFKCNERKAEEKRREQMAKFNPEIV